MKLIRSILALIVFVGFSFSMTAQNVTINKSQVTLETVLDDLSRQTGFEFLHSRPTVNPDEIVSLNVSGVSLETALQKLFSNKPIGYEIKDSKVYLIAKDTPDTPKKDEKVVVTGTIVDATGLPVIGAGVIVKGTTRGVSTGLDGEFSIEVDPSETLLFSSIGYDDVEILVGNQTTLSVVMNESSLMLAETVVIGYGAVKKRDVSTAISQIKSEDIANHSISDFRQAMVGKMAGVSVMQTSGDPEGSVMVRVRGIGSATAGNDPLYVIDGVPVESGLSNINANDIESMEVLKDASSAAIYGSRGSNGVILVTTKKGSSEKLTVGYDGYYALDMVSKKLPMMDAYEYAQFVKEGHDNAYYDANPGGTDPNGSRSDSWANYPVEIIPYRQVLQTLTGRTLSTEMRTLTATISHSQERATM